MISQDPNPTIKQAFLVLSNKYTSRIIDLCNEIRRSSAVLGDTFLLFHQKAPIASEALNNKDCFLFTDSVLTDLHYIPISTTLVPGNNHFPLLDFYRKNPHYDFYWFIEDDVRFNGAWEQFFNYFTRLNDQPDFISSHLRTYNEEPHWFWWNTLYHFNQYIPLFLRIRSFNPIYRISNAALNCIHYILYADKWRGHHEVLLPTMLMLEGLQIADFGGTGHFVPTGLENRFYLDDDADIHGEISAGTMRYRPLIDNLELADKLYHPVKK
jgi:hypothetical protein